MQIEIFTTGSNTTADRDDVTYIVDFFEGSFLPVNTLVEELSEFGDTTTHILSDEYGYLRGRDRVADISQQPDSTDPQTTFCNHIEQAATAADVVVILLTKSVFESAVSDHWDDIVADVNTDSIWCLGAPQSVIVTSDLEPIRRNATRLLTYRRVGVARIGSETRTALLGLVKKTAKERLD